MSFLQLFRHINTFIFDVDGVLTDGSLLVLENGDQVRRMNIKDGYALQLAIKMGYRVVIISGSQSEGVRSRLQKLGIRDIFMQTEDKQARMLAYAEENKLAKKSILFMGDDIPDYAAMKEAGVSCAPADAAAAIRDIAQYVSPFRGGEGCVRDVIEKVLTLNNHWTLDTFVPSR
jgi:3-deoxy-D-manno-octulosonate 8-phosphate phosphatase (KDO 8-P phosphatase)